MYCLAADGLEFPHQSVFVYEYLSVSLLLTFCVISLLLHAVLGLIPPKYPHAVPANIDYDVALRGLSPWIAAVCLTMRSLKLGQGGLVYLGSQNGFHNNLILDCLLITIVMIFLPFFYTLFHIIAIDSYILETVKGDLSKLNIVGRNLFMLKNTIDAESLLMAKGRNRCSQPKEAY
ncbi:hypothetical protein OESDEN_09295 [Oesophagostomum dentatum]|uniref:Uncharacterized protein n=1 Tax=Oesophagostomum dentatum TaxID=61180 RepID=A0A0B1SZY1_OESDE|nr:hypothetical protein OESDEN_09295 [Oesophagostomum dentatum]